MPAKPLTPASPEPRKGFCGSCLAPVLATDAKCHQCGLTLNPRACDVAPAPVVTWYGLTLTPEQARAHCEAMAERAASLPTTIANVIMNDVRELHARADAALGQ